VLYVVALHVLIFFNGLYPILGRWAVELRGISLIAISILCLVLLIWGTLHLKKWAWWGDLLYFSWMSITWVVTLAQSSWAELLYALGFPPFEVTILQNLPFQGGHFAVLLGLPLTLTMGLIVYTKGYFEA